MGKEEEPISWIRFLRQERTGSGVNVHTEQCKFDNSASNLGFGFEGEFEIYRLPVGIRETISRQAPFVDESLKHGCKVFCIKYSAF